MATREEVSWARKYWKLRVALAQASLWKLFKFWLNGDEERLSRK